MRRRNTTGWRITPALLTVLSAAAVSLAGDEPEPPRGREYGITVESNLKMKPPKGVKENTLRIDIWARFDYFVDRRPDEVGVSLRSEDMRVRQNGKTVQETRVTRASLLQRPKPGAPFLNIPYGKAPESLQEHLRTFGTPLVAIALNAHGHEVGRKVLVGGPSADTQVGLAETILSVHGPFPDDVDSWEAPGKIAMGQGRTASGILKFEKSGRVGGSVRVKVSGRLRVSGILGPGKVKDGTYDVTGEQTWDTAGRAWTSARWSVAIVTELTTGDDEPVGRAEGTLVLTMGPLEGLHKSAGEADKARAGAVK